VDNLVPPSALSIPQMKALLGDWNPEPPDRTEATLRLLLEAAIKNRYRAGVPIEEIKS
jgi:hypothetical protein